MNIKRRGQMVSANMPKHDKSSYLYIVTFRPCHVARTWNVGMTIINDATCSFRTGGPKFWDEGFCAYPKAVIFPPHEMSNVSKTNGGNNMSPKLSKA
jgi:hypothetical protein